MKLNSTYGFLFLLIIILSLKSCTVQEPEREIVQCTDPEFGDTIGAVYGIEDGVGFIEITNVWGSSMADLTFEWDNGLGGPHIVDLSPGIYTVTITDPSGCTATEDYDLTLSEPEGYRIGDTGPAGGIIFYVYSDGRALEAAPASTIRSNVKWGCKGTSFNTSQQVGSGKDNTQLILNGCEQNGIAVSICDQLEVNGFSDWYLPSVDEIDRLSYAVYQNNPQDYPSGEYWSSSEVTSTIAYSGQLPEGGISYRDKDNGAYVIAIRVVSP